MEIHFERTINGDILIFFENEDEYGNSSTETARFQEGEWIDVEDFWDRIKQAVKSILPEQIL